MWPIYSSLQYELAVNDYTKVIHIEPNNPEYYLYKVCSVIPAVLKLSSDFETSIPASQYNFGLVKNSGNFKTKGVVTLIQ